MIHPLADVEAGAYVHESADVWRWVHVQAGAIIEAECMIGQGCYIAGEVGPFTRIQNGVYVWEGVWIGSHCFIGPNVCFTNVKNPTSGRRGLKSPTTVRRGAVIGANATIICGVIVGEGAFVAAGAVVTKDVPPGKLVAGVPARVVGDAPGEND